MSSGTLHLPQFPEALGKLPSLRVCFLSVGTVIWDLSWNKEFSGSPLPGSKGPIARLPSAKEVIPVVMVRKGSKSLTSQQHPGTATVYKDPIPVFILERGREENKGMKAPRLEKLWDCGDRKVVPRDITLPED